MKVGGIGIGASLLLVVAACGGAGSTGGGRELPLSSDQRCETEEYDLIGCIGGEPAAVGTTLVDDDMTVRHVGSEIERPETGDPVNTSGIRATLYLEIENTRDSALHIADYEPDLRFDGVFERSGGNLVDCRIVPRDGEIAPGATATIRFCGYLATVGEIAADELQFDLAAPCAFCEVYLDIAPELDDPTVVEAVAATVADMAAAGYGTDDELGIGDLDRADGTGEQSGDDTGIGSEDDVGSSEVAPPPPPPPPPPPTSEPISTTPPPTTTSTEATAATTEPDSAPPSSTAPPADGDVAAELGIVLGPDGLGLVGFDETLGATVGRLTEALGPPDTVGEPFFQPGIGSVALYTWGRLTVEFNGGNELFFSAYELARPYDVAYDEETDEYSFEFLPWEPADWEATAATAEGVTIGLPANDAAAIHPVVYAPVCGEPMDERTFTDVLGTADQLFVEDDQQGLFFREPLDGTIWSIGAQVRPNPMLCDGFTG